MPRSPDLAANLIRTARARAGMTQSQLAVAAGMRQQAVSAYETGRKQPTLPKLQSLLAAAGLEMRIQLETAPERAMPTGTPRRPAVLFLCVHNAGRSQMAAGWLRHIAGDRIEVLSGGSEPVDTVNPAAVAAMAEAGIDIGGRTPQQWTDEVVRTADVVVTMGCGDACPVYPGPRYEDWALTDPAGQPLEVVRGVRDEIEARVRRLVGRLGHRRQH